MDALGDAIAVVGSGWRVRHINAALEQMFGVRAENAIDADFWTTYPGFAAEPCATMIRATAADGSTRCFDFEHGPSGEARSFGVRVARDAKGNTILALSQPLQVTTSDHDRILQELLEQAQEADRAKGRFLATMSHELRTPLTALAGYEELLVDEVLGQISDAQREVLERMHYVTEHLAAVIEEVLAYTNIESGGESVRATDFLAADLLSAVAAVVQPLADQKRITLVSQSEAKPIRMTTDIDKARQIIVNLASNAIKFTERGEVRLGVTQERDEVRFGVSDTGIGISPADIQRLFRPFTQLDSGLTRKYGGTGLGLYISQRLAELLRGRIEVSSTAGVGSTFTLVLPRE
jgi:signal transduction histidine kinase